ncbi:MAG: T9SS type A sorting domain-containing protein [bacterium]|nr:T9SS type A sorting domain-containing protein [bacterium]
MNKITLLFIMSLICSFTYGQDVNYEFEWSGWEAPGCNPFKTDPFYCVDQVNWSGNGGYCDWKVSHGSPQIIGNQGAYNIGYFKFTTSSNYEKKSEGLYIDYNFEEGYYYEVYANVKINTGDVGMEIAAANGMNETSNTECIEEEIPAVDDKVTIKSTNNVGQFAIGGYTDFGEDNWLAEKNYNYFWLLSKDGGGSGSFNVISVTIIKGRVVDPPSTPTNLAASNITYNGSNLTWNKPYGFVSSYNIYRNSIKIGNSKTTSFNVTGLAQSTNYIFSVEAVNPGGVSGRVNIDVRTLPKPPTISVSNLSQVGCVLSWSSTGAAKYDVYKNNSLITSTTSASVTINNLCPETEYTFYVKAYDNVKYSLPSNTFNINTPPFTLTGSDIICSSYQLFGIGGSVSNSYVKWTHSTNIERVGSQGQALCSFWSKSPEMNGVGWIQAAFSITGCETASVKRDVWVGKPALENLTVKCNTHSMYPPISVDLNSTHNYFVTPSYLYNMNDGGYFTWETWGGDATQSTGITNTITYNQWIHATLIVSRRNECGVGLSVMNDINVEKNSGGGNPGGGGILIDPFAKSSSKSTNIEFNNLSVFPNPAQTSLNVEIPGSFNFHNDEVSVTIFNSLSVAVYNEKFNSNSIKINVENIPNGIYIMQVIYNKHK